ncbi:hypothetical protein B0H10DRAFT_2055322 [Mycena sp. CBHHK59/15]|nr:hypothetical protein B0H10DRAFT_2055322 [Mycena sp. CBHHK59/15]
MIPFSLLFCPHVACSAQDVYSKGHDRRLMTRQMCRGMQFPPYDFHPGVLYRCPTPQLGCSLSLPNLSPRVFSSLRLSYPAMSFQWPASHRSCVSLSLCASYVVTDNLPAPSHALAPASTAPTVRSPPGALTVCLVSGDVHCDSTIVLCLSSIVLCHRHPAFAPHRPIVAPHRPANTDLFMHYDSVLGR